MVPAPVCAVQRIHPRRMRRMPGMAADVRLENATTSLS
jgi:hypothetical protein